MQPSEFGLESPKSPLGNSMFSSLTIRSITRARPPTARSGAIALPCLADGAEILTRAKLGLQLQLLAEA
jgi:hypothetical protein